MSPSAHPSNASNPRRRTRSLKVRDRNARLALERLEERMVLSTFDVTGGALLYSAASGQSNNVFLSTTGAGGVLNLSDSGDSITLTANALAAGFTVDGTQHVVFGPENNVATIKLDTADGNDVDHIQSAIKPLLIVPTNPNSGTQTIYLGTANVGVQGITNTVTIGNPNGRTTVNIDDSGNTASGRTATFSGSTISGLSPSSITLNAGTVSTLNVFGGTQGNTFNINSTLAPTTNLSTGLGNDSTTVTQLSAGAALNIQGQSGIDSVFVGAGSLNGIAGTVDVKNTSGQTSLSISDSSDATARSVNVSGTTTTGFNGGLATVTYNPAQIGSFNVLGGSGGNTFTINGTIPGQNNTFDTGFGSDRVVLQATAIGSVVNIHGQNGFDLVNIGNGNSYQNILGSAVNISNSGSFSNVVVDDSNDGAASHNVLTTVGSLTGLTPNGPINYTTNDVSSLTIKGGSVGDNFTISNNGLSTYTTNITGGAGNDSFIFTNGATLSGGEIDGGAGSDTLDYSAYTTPVTVNLHSSQQVATGTNFVANIETAIGGSGGNTFAAPAGVSSTLTGGAGVDTFIIPADAGNVTVNGTGNDNLQVQGQGSPDTFNVSTNGATVSTTVTGSAATHSVTSTGIIAITLAGGTNDTTATVNFAGGNPIPAGGINYTGGGGTNNVLRLVNNLPTAPNSFINEVYNATGPGAGNINLDGSVVNFSGLSPVYDSTAAMNFTFNAPAAVNNIQVTSVATVNGVANGNRIASGNASSGFESIDFTNKTNATINSVTDTDTSVTVNAPIAGASLANLTINTGNGNDLVNLIATPNGVNFAANTGSGNDTVDVNAGGLGGPAIVDSSTATGTLNYDAGNLTTSETATTLASNPAQSATAIKSGTQPTLTAANFTTVSINHLLDLPLVNAPTSVSIQEGKAFTGVVGSFSVSNPAPIAGQVNPTSVAGDFVASINFGDGTPAVAGTIVANNTGGFDVIGTHTFAITSTPAISVSVTHKASSSTAILNGVTTTLQTNGGSTTTIASSAAVTDAPLVASSSPVLATEGSPLAAGTLLATFTDANPLGTLASFSGSVTWGDGTGSFPVAISASAVPGTYLVRSAGNHTFVESGLNNVTVTINDVGGTTAVTTGTATVADAALVATGTNVIAVDGNPFTGQVATFTDANPAAPISDFTTTIQWGNGVTTPGTITQPGGVGTAFVVTGTQTFKAGTFPVSVSIKDVGGSTATSVSTATISAATLVPNGAGAALTTVEGQPFTAQLGAFTSGNPIANVLQFAAVVNWGDGTSSNGTITQSSAGVFSVTGNHTYAVPSASNPIVVTVTDTALGGNVSTITGSAVVNDAKLSSTGAPVLGVEGAPIAAGTLVASFSDADSAATAAGFTSTINWGDGTSSTGTITAAGGLVSGFLVKSATPHTYARYGNYSVQVTVTDTAPAGANASVTVAASNATITDAALAATGTNIAAVEGTIFTGRVATFSDANPIAPISDFTATIEWGNGVTTPGTVTQPDGAGSLFVVTGTQTYLKSGSFPIAVTIKDIGGASATATSLATVAGAALTAGATTALTGTESVPLTAYVGTFTSANPLATASDFTSSVNWGDGTPISLGTILQAPNGTFYVTATHTYAEETAAATPNAFTVTVKSSAGVFATLTGTAAISDAALSASPVPIITSVEGTSSVLKTATFVDSDPNGTVADYSVVIHWGDGSTSNTAAVTITPTGSTNQGATFSISAPHTYAEEGNYLVTTTVTEIGGSSATTTSPASVANAELVGTGIPVVATENVPIVNVPVATFVDLGGAENLSEYTATVDWGDGTTPSAGAISLGANGMTFTVTGSHLFQESGTYPVTVIVTHVGADNTVIRTTATVGSQAVTLTGNLDASSDSGVSQSDKITNIVQPVFSGTSEPGTIIKLYAAKDGANNTLVGTGVAGADGAWSIRSSPLVDGAYLVTATATDPDAPTEVTGPVVLLGGVDPSRPALVIDTVGPVITEVIFRRALGKIIIAFQDFGGGITTANINDGINYSFTQYAKASFPPNLVTSFSVLQNTTTHNPIEMDLFINHGHPLRSGRYILNVKSSGITDIAGNHLDGAFYGYLPTGNHKPGVDFQALLISNRSATFAPLPTTTSATPLTPPGKKPHGFLTPTPHQTHSIAAPVRIQTAAVAHVAAKKVSVNVHDAALAHVTVSNFKRKK